MSYDHGQISDLDSSDAAKLRILIVEDEFLIRLTLAEVLADEGYDVLEAETGDDAMAILANEPCDCRSADRYSTSGQTGRPRPGEQARANTAGSARYLHDRAARHDSRQSANAREMFVAKPYLPSEICAAVKRMLAATPR